MLISGYCVMARMSISLRNEQGSYFMQQIGSKTPISTEKRFGCQFQRKRDGKNGDFT